MHKTILTLALIMALMLVDFLPVARSHVGSPLSAWTYSPPTIDGIINAAEWAPAASVSYTTTGGISGAFHVMNDATNLYVAVTTTDPTLSQGTTVFDAVILYFDNNHNGLGPESGDDIIGWNGYQNEGFKDSFSSGTYVILRDTDYGGTSDGAAAASNDGTHNLFEMMHPLNTADDAHDFSLSIGDTVGFGIRIVVDGFDKGWWPSSDPSSWGDIVISGMPPGFNEYTMAVPSEPLTVDPAKAYDTASCELIQNVYDPLVFLKGTDPSQIVPWLATSWTVTPNGLTYTFVIRQNVSWQAAPYGFVLPEDVAYSLQKMLVRDYTGGPAWLLWVPIFGIYSATDYGDLTDPAVATALGNAIAGAISYNNVDMTVTIHFQTGVAYLPFLNILAQTCGSIQSQEWCINNGDWNPVIDKLSDGTWVNAHDPASSPLDNPTAMMGSGPFEFNYLVTGVAWSIIRNGGQASDPHPTTVFWGGWAPNRMERLGFPTGTKSRGYVDEIVEYFVDDYATRLAGFAGVYPIYDTIAVPRNWIPDVWQQPGIRCTYPQSVQAIDAMFFGFNVSMQSPYIGSPTSPTYFGENGIRPDFFSDIHARKAVAYSFDWDTYIASAWLGEAVQVGVPLPNSAGDPTLMYHYNLALAISEWQQAWGGQVWASGFNFDIVYNSGNAPRQLAAQMLKNALEVQNPKFHVDIVSVAWNAYDLMLHGGPGGHATAPIFIDGWLGDFLDPDDWATPFMQSTAGTFGYAQHIDMDPSSGLIDSLIEDARYAATPAARNAYYQQLWQLYHDEALSLPLEQPLGRRWSRDWVHGWYYNPLFSGSTASYVGESVASYFYTMWKEDIYCTSGVFADKHANWEDINEDGKVDIKDLAIAAKAFGAYFIQPLLPPNPAGPPGTHSANWNSKADLNVVNVATGGRGDMKVDIKDLATMAKLFGFVADPWTPGP